MAKKKEKEKESNIKPICKNRKAHYEYSIIDKLECGLVLSGTEVKSLRERAANLEDAFARIKDGELWLFNADIPEYSMANKLNHKPKRPRKLLVHKREMGKFAGKASEQGLTLVPLRMYFKNGYAKVEIAVAKGKKLYDKREDQKKKDAQKDIKREMNRRR